jgi:hypothetical protein
MLPSGEFLAAKRRRFDAFRLLKALSRSKGKNIKEWPNPQKLPIFVLLVFLRGSTSSDLNPILLLVP